MRRPLPAPTMSRQQFTQKDKDGLARFLLNVAEADRTTPATHKDAALKLPGHSWQSWHTHYRNNREDIDRRIEQLRRQRDRAWEANKQKQKDKGKGKAKEVEPGGDAGDDGEGEQGSPPRTASTSAATKKKKKRRSEPATDTESEPEKLSTAPIKRTRVKFTQKNWSKLILALVKAQDHGWPKNKLFEYLAEKYPHHTDQSWQTYWRNNQKEATKAVESYLKDRARLGVGPESSSGDSDVESEPEPPKKRQKKAQQTAPRPSTSASATAAASTTNSKGKGVARAEPVPNGDGFESPSPSEASSRDADFPVTKNPPPVAKVSKTSSLSAKGKEKERRPEVLVLDADDGVPEALPPAPSRQADRRPSASTSSARLAPIPASAVASTSRATKPLPSSAPPARRATSISTSTSATSKGKSTSRPTLPPARPAAPAQPVRPAPAPLPPVATAAPSPRSLAQSRSNLAKASQIPLPLDDDDDDLVFEAEASVNFDGASEEGGDAGGHDDEREPSTQDSAGDDGEIEADEIANSTKQLTRDDELLVRELCRSEWLELTRQSAFENLFILYPWRVAKEWEQLYLDRRPDFMHLIGLAIEQLEEEGEGDNLTPELKEEKIVEELTRCELLGLEKNLVAWDNLAKLYTQTSEQEWKSFHGKTKRSVWQKRIAESVRRIVEERLTRQGGRQAKQRREPLTKKETRVERNVEKERNKQLDKGKGKAREESCDEAVEQTKAKAKAPDGSPVPPPPRTATTSRLVPPTPPRQSSPPADDPPRSKSRSPSPPLNDVEQALPSPSDSPGSAPRVLSPDPAERPVPEDHDEERAEVGAEEEGEEDFEESQIEQPFSMEIESAGGEVIDPTDDASGGTTRTTSSDRQLIEHLERVVEETQAQSQQGEDEEEANRDQEDQEMDASDDEDVRAHRELEAVDAKEPSLDGDESELDLDIHSPFDRSDPFKQFDPSEPVYEELTNVEQDLVFGHVRILDGARAVEARKRDEVQARAAAHGVEEVERGDGKTGRPENDHERQAGATDIEAEPIVGTVVASIKGKEVVRDVQGPDDTARPHATHGQKRRRSSHSGSEVATDKRESRDEAEEINRPKKKPRIGSAAQSTSSSSMSKEDVGQWREQVQTAQSSSRPSFAPGPAPRSSPRIPRASLTAVATAAAQQRPTTEVSPRPSSENPPAASKTLAPPRRTNPAASQELNSKLASIASDFGVSFSSVAGLYFCVCAPSNLKPFRQYVSFFSPKHAPPEGSEKWRYMNPHILKNVWTYEDDKVVLEGTEDEKDEVRKRRGSPLFNTRKDFLMRSHKDKVDKLPLEFYDRTA
ncbi:hypothetical protein JCM11491_004904 [Sporobolomyces phaffii]